MSTPITLTAPSLPSGYCWPASPQTLFTDAIAWGLSAEFNFDTINTYYNYGDSTPTADYRGYAWLRTGATNSNENGWFTWDATLSRWIKPHAVPPSSDARWIWIGSTVDLQSFDGGNTNAVADADGPMWEVDSNFAAKFPVGVGTFTASGDVAVGGSTTSTGVSGEDKHTLVTSELPAHSHSISAMQGLDIDESSNRTLSGTDGNADEFQDSMNTETEGDDTGHNNLPPFYGCYFIKRTGRKFYAVSP